MSRVLRHFSDLLMLHFSDCFLRIYKFEENISPAAAVSIVTHSDVSCKTKIQGPCYFSCKEKNLEASILLMQSPFLNKPCFWNTGEPKQGAGCWAFSYSSQLLLASSRPPALGCPGPFSHILGWRLLPGSVSMAFPHPPPTCIATHNIKWKPLFGVVTDLGFLMELPFFFFSF